MTKGPEQNFELPKSLHELAETNIRQARSAFDGFISTARKNAALAEWRATAAQPDAQEVWERAITLAEKNAAASFDFALRLVRVTNPRELLDVQAEFAQTQMRAAAEQAAELGQTVSKIMANLTKPKA